jgi:hypothetical protein
MTKRPKEDAMKGKIVVIAAGAALLGVSVAASRRAKSMHERCKEACAQMAGKGTPGEGETDPGNGPQSEGGKTHRPCGPAECGK